MYFSDCQTPSIRARLVAYLRKHGVSSVAVRAFLKIAQQLADIISKSGIDAKSHSGNLVHALSFLMDAYFPPDLKGNEDWEALYFCLVFLLSSMCDPNHLQKSDFNSSEFVPLFLYSNYKLMICKEPLELKY